MNSRFLGGILLIVGTSIGGGMLALPVANAASGFWFSALYLILCWAVMTLGAFFILEANLYLPPGKNMISMAAATLGVPGLVVAWVSYLILLYTLLAAYIAGGADVLGSILATKHFAPSAWQSAIIFTLLFGLAAYGGIRPVDFLNRGLMFAKLSIYSLLVFFIAPYIQSKALAGGQLSALPSTTMILITSFGFAIIVPNLREYFNDDLKTLKRVIFIGSLIPLICYLAWDAVIMGSLPASGKDGLISLLRNPHTTSALAALLSQSIQNPFISLMFNTFTSICMLTAFLGVSLCLLSFLADGLNITKKGREGVLLFLLTFCPPLLLVIYYPGAYIAALHYAGIFCVILLLLLPTLMTVAARPKQALYQVRGGKMSQVFVIMMSVLALAYAIGEQLTTAYK